MVKVGTWVKVVSNEGSMHHGLKVGTLAVCVELEDDGVHRFRGVGVYDTQEEHYICKKDYEEVV